MKVKLVYNDTTRSPWSNFLYCGVFEYFYTFKIEVQFLDCIIQN